MDERNSNFFDIPGTFGTVSDEYLDTADHERRRSDSTFCPLQADQQRLHAELAPLAQSHSAPTIGRTDHSSTPFPNVGPELVYGALSWVNDIAVHQAPSRTHWPNDACGLLSDDVVAPQQGSHAVSGSVVESYVSPFMNTESKSRPAHEETTGPLDHGAASSANARVRIPTNVASGQRVQRTTGGRVPCDLCEKDFAREADLERHKNDVHRLARVEYVCTACGVTRYRKDKMREHVTKEHGKSTPDSFYLRNIDEPGVT